MYTKESISSLLRVYTGKVKYTKTCGTKKEYMMKYHPLNEWGGNMHKPTHPEKVVLWCLNKIKWRYLRPEGVTHIQTEF